MSVAPDQTGQPALDLHAARFVALCLILPVRGIEPDQAPFSAEGLESRFLIVDQRHDDFTFMRGVDLADERKIAVENAFIDHRVTRHFERIMLAWAEQS